MATTEALSSSGKGNTKLAKQYAFTCTWAAKFTLRTNYDVNNNKQWWRTTPELLQLLDLLS